METELKPCPFCGGKAIFAGGSCEDNGRGYFVCENNCVEQRHICNLEEATEAWNRRAEDGKTD
jgi:hypothetical protein